MKKFKNVLFITSGYPRKKDPMNCPFIGYRIAFLRKNEIKADVLSLNELTFCNNNSFYKKVLYFWTLFFPFFVFEKYTFAGQRYRIFRFYYTFASRYWILMFVYFLKIKYDYSIFHYHFLWSIKELIFLKKYLKNISIVSIHGSDLHQTAVVEKEKRKLFKKTLKYADKIIYVSKGLRELAKKIKLDTKKDIVIPNGFDGDIFYFKDSNFDNNTFGFVGHLYRIKRADKLAEIFKIIKKKIPNAKLIIAGGGNSDENLKNLMIEQFKKFNLMDSVKFVGEVDHDKLAKHYSKMNILLVPSRNEGFPNVIVEARASGVFIAGTRIGGIPEAIEDAGITVKEGPDFEKRFAEAAVKLSQKLFSREEVSKKAQKFNWDEIIKKEIAVYKEFF